MKRLPVWLLLGSALAFGDGAGPVAIRNARVVPVSGPMIDRGTVVLRNGLIEAVGADAAIPPDAWIIEGAGLTVYPGLIDALSTFGIPEAAPPANGAGRGGAAPQATPPAPATPAATAPANPPARGPEDRPMTTSWVRAADLVRPSDRRLNSVRAAGFTTAVTFPLRGIFAGQGAIVNLGGETAGQMIVADNAGQYVTFATSGAFGGGFPNSLMGVVAYVRQVYLDAEHYQLAKQFYAAHSRGTPRPDYDRALEGVLDSPRVLLPARRRIDVDRLLRLADELRLKAVLYGLPEGYRSADLLKKADAAALVNLRWPERNREADPDEPDPLQVLRVRDQAPSTPAMLVRNGVKFALYSGGIDRRADLLRALKRAFDAGLTPDEALRAMTLSPAEIYGVADRLGSIEKGKIANLVVTKGDLFQDQTEVKYVFIDGIKFEPVEEPAPAGATPEAGPPVPSSPQGGRE
ncbi:MAG TPA: amidohydrolase family protein [Bryobacteraceae bacterium]|nr:amidohydrolase family protein [Bryobacteraceae bacterium]